MKPVSQRIAFYFAMTHFLLLLVTQSIRVYFDFVGDHEGFRRLSKYAPMMELFLVGVVNWIVAFFLVTVSILDSRSITRYGRGHSPDAIGRRCSRRHLDHCHLVEFLVIVVNGSPLASHACEPAPSAVSSRSMVSLVLPNSSR